MAYPPPAPGRDDPRSALTIVGFFGGLIDERPRAFGLIAIILAMLAAAIAIWHVAIRIGPWHSGCEPLPVLSPPRYSALFTSHGWFMEIVAARLAVHASLLAITCSVAPANIAFGLQYGRRVRVSEQRVERALRARAPSTELMSRTCPAIYPDRNDAYECFQALKAAGFGEFKSFNDDRVATAPDPPPTVRR